MILLTNSQTSTVPTLNFGMHLQFDFITVYFPQILTSLQKCVCYCISNWWHAVNTYTEIVCKCLLGIFSLDPWLYFHDIWTSTSITDSLVWSRVCIYTPSYLLWALLRNLMHPMVNIYIPKTYKIQCRCSRFERNSVSFLQYIDTIPCRLGTTGYIPLLLHC